MFVDDVRALFDRSHNVCVVGSGPVGLVVAMELARQGQSVTLIESGRMAFDARTQELSAAARDGGQDDVDMSLAMRRAFGGTSNLWGAGCIPLDPIDFEDRDWIDGARWPLEYKAFAEHLPAACAYANCGYGFESAIEGFDVDDPRFAVNRLIRYADPPSFAKAHKETIRTDPRIAAFMGMTVTGFRFAENGRIECLEARTPGGISGLIGARVFILACGGVETARLLLAAQAGAPARFGGTEGALGRYYMGHLSGAIAGIDLHGDELDRGFDFLRCADGAYARRRIVADADLQRREELSNVSFWPVMAPMGDFTHRDPVLSLAYLALSVPPLGRALVSESLRRVNVGDGRNRLQHVRNVAVGALSVAAFLPHFAHGRYLEKRRLPGLHLRNRARRYVLHYHAEHLPNPASRIRLSEERDALGLPRIRHELRFCQGDAESVARTHEHLSHWLESTGSGRLIWHMPHEKRVAAVMSQAGDGVHQIGTARMARNARDGVVDRDCRVFGSSNLFLAGSAVFPTSGQANPTLSAIALGVRTAWIIATEVAQHSSAVQFPV